MESSPGHLAFPDCNNSEQSPIDLTEVEENENLTTIQTSYDNTPLDIENNGHTVEMPYEAGSTMTVNGNTYELLQFHFHTPGEHTVQGESSPLEVHLVHRRALGNGEVEFAVIGVLFEEDDSNATLAKVFNNMPAEEGEVAVHGEEINVNDLLPDVDQYYHYKGSFTTPPCTEGVQWY